MRSSGDLSRATSVSTDGIARAAHTVEITEAYHDYEPPFDIASTARALLDGVPESRLPGLERIVLTNIDALPAGRKRAKTWARGRKVKVAETCGLYHQEWGSDPAWIEIFVDKLTADIPRFVFASRFLRDIIVAGVLYHEIGHHLHHAVAREHGERESIAEKWRRRLSRSHLRRNYWYFLPVANLARRLHKVARLLGNWKARFVSRSPVSSSVRTRSLGNKDLRETWPPRRKKTHE